MIPNGFGTHALPDNLMRKILFVIVACLGVLWSITSNITNNRVQKRLTYWRSLLDDELPAGTPKETVERWGRQRNLPLSWISDRNFFNANVEQVPDAGFGFPCAEWNVIIDIYVDAEGKTNKQDVHVVGSCI